MIKIKRSALLILLALILGSCGLFKRNSKVTITETIPAISIDTTFGTPIDTNCIDSTVIAVLQPQNAKDSAKAIQLSIAINKQVKGAVKLPERIILKEGGITAIISKDSTGKARVQIQKPEVKRVTEFEAQETQKPNQWKLICLTVAFILLLLILGLVLRRK